VTSSQASAQYVTTIAMLALLVSDRITDQQFRLLNRPFATAIPTAGGDVA
jgi:hypothetical protein